MSATISGWVMKDIVGLLFWPSTTSAIIMATTAMSGPHILFSSENSQQHCLGAGMRTMEAIVLCVNTILATGREKEQGTVWFFRQGHFMQLTPHHWISQATCPTVTEIFWVGKLESGIQNLGLNFKVRRTLNDVQGSV